MPKSLYLDTARLGQMSPRACRASVDFARFASEHGGALYLSDLLRGGVQALPRRVRQNFLGLSDWQGVAAFKDSLRRITRSHANAQVLVAARAAVLMRLAARLLVRPCRNVMLTDLTWPAYDRILRRELPKSACNVTKINVRHAIFRGQLDSAELVEMLTLEFVRHRCDGLFLPLVDNLGIRLPLPNIVNRIRRETELRFVVVDGAQAIHHVPLDLAEDYCDILVAGCHKWLGAFTPMGIAFYGHPRSRDYINCALERWKTNGIIDDPLLSFASELQSEQTGSFGETVAVSPMIAANGAVSDALASTDDVAHAVRENRASLLDASAASGWTCLSPENDLASRILLFQSSRRCDEEAQPDHLRRRFLACHVVLTAYANGIVRASIAASPFDAGQKDSLRAAFSS